MIEVLAPVRADHDQRWTLDCLTELHQQEPIHVHLLSVQPHYSGHVRMFLSPDWIHEVQEEDIAICEAVQKGLSSGAYEAGRLCPKRESGVWHFQNLLRAAYIADSKA